MPKIAKYDQQQQSEYNIGTKRRTSYGQITIDSPTILRNAANERFKFNPDYFLPDGTLRRKFSLPKLSDSLEQFKACRYIKRNSLVEPTVDESDVSNIFKYSKPGTPESTDINENKSYEEINQEFF